MEKWKWFWKWIPWKNCSLIFRLCKGCGIQSLCIFRGKISFFRVLFILSSCLLFKSEISFTRGFYFARNEGLLLQILNHLFILNWFSCLEYIFCQNKHFFYRQLNMRLTFLHFLIWIATIAKKKRNGSYENLVSLSKMFLVKALILEVFWRLK